MNNINIVSVPVILEKNSGEICMYSAIEISSGWDLKTGLADGEYDFDENKEMVFFIRVREIGVDRIGIRELRDVKKMYIGGILIFNAN